MERRSWSACSPPTLAGSGSCAVGPTARRSSRCIVRARSVYLAVAACAVIVYLGALWNEFVWDDQVIVLGDRKSTRLNSSHGYISYAVFGLKKKNTRIAHELRSL